MIIQVRLDPDQVEGEHSGYYNYEFGLARYDYTDEDDDYICQFFGGERGAVSFGQNRRNYSVASHEASVILDEED